MRLMIACALCVTVVYGASVDLQAHSQSPTREMPPVSQDATLLGADARVERVLRRGEEHRYQLRLSVGEYVRLIVEQHDIDVTVRTCLPDGRPIADFQEEIRRRGEEQVELVAEEAGVFVVQVSPGPGIASGSYVLRVASRRAATAADRSMQEARALKTQAAERQSAFKWPDARSLLERAVTVAEALRGPDDVFVGIALFDLARIATTERDEPRSLSLYQRALGIFEGAWGSEHPYPGMVRVRMALLLQRADEVPKAEALLREGTDVIERTLGTDHPWFALCMTTLGNLRISAGDVDAAVAAVTRALTILEPIEDTEASSYAGALTNFAYILIQKRDARAESYIHRALAVIDRLEGPESFIASINYQNLGIIARERKDYAKAVEHYTHALSIRERELGQEHADVAPMLNNLGIVQRLTGDAAGSIQTHLRALRIFEKTRGPYHTAALNAVGNIARTYALVGDVGKTIEYQRRAEAIVETQLTLNLAVGSERQKLAFVKSIVERTDRTISLALNEAAGDPDATALASLVLLQRKGRVLDAMTDTFAAVRHKTSDPTDGRLLDELRATTTQLARLVLNMPPGMSAEDRQQRSKQLEAQKERLEAELGARSAQLRAELRPVTLAAVQAALPADCALVEFAVFRPFDPTAEQNADAYGAARYAAYVIRKDAPPRGYDLGAAGAIDEAVDALRQSLRDVTRSDLKARARLVDDLVLRPLRASLGAATRLLISPDGDLNLVPFEAFVDEQGRYLLQRYAMTYLTSGRDLLRMHVGPTSQRSGVVIVADPFFGEPAPAIVDQPARKVASARAQTRSVTSADALSSMYFARLAGTAAEGFAINALFPEATLLTGRRATKDALEQLDAPRILHIASHGFFLLHAVDNPLLRSGLALAGANLTSDTDNAGILTALEASSLNLRGTKLVTLSACDTGVGEVRNGEGVYGLRRAFVLAGTETLVMSLWPISDSITREAMISYYTGLRAGLGRGDALRQAKLAMLQQRGREHPFYWSSFIQSGEWASLDGTR